MGDGVSSGVSGGSFAFSRRGVLLLCLGVLMVAGVMLHRVYEAWPSDEGSFFGVPMFRWKAALATGVFCSGVLAAALGLGALFWWMVLRVTGAGWSDDVRGVWCGLCRASVWGWLLVLLVLQVMLPVLYPWAMEAARAAAAGQAVDWGGNDVRGWWLAEPFFKGRSCAVFGLFAVMFLLMGMFRRRGRARHERLVAAVCLPLLVAVVAVAGVDWWMVRSAWVSSMLPFCFLAFGATAAVAAAVLAGAGSWTKSVVRKMGLLLLAALAFKVYFSYSQFMLIQYGNLPHEWEFYRVRSAGMWEGWLPAMFGVWVLCVLAMAFVPACRRRRGALRVVAVLALAASAAEGFWYVAPGIVWDVPDAAFVWVYAGCLAVVAGMGWLVFRAFGSGREAEE